MRKIARVLTVIGDPDRIDAWSGIPYFFLRAGREQGFLSAGLPLRPEDLRFQRLVWNLGRVARGARPGGFQYTEVFLRPLFAQADLRADEVEIISHFPLLPPLPWRPGWRVSYYIDATLRQNFVDYGLADRVSRKVREEALRREAEHYHAAERVVCMSRWAANSVVEDYGIPPSKVHAILPGANLRDSDVGSSTDQAEPPPLSPSAPGLHRQGLAKEGSAFPVAGGRGARAPKGRRARGGAWPARGGSALTSSAGMRRLHRQAARFAALRQLVRSCHFGCLFSSVEACGIANLECLRLGVPVLASRVGGIPDTVRDGLAYLFEPGCAPDRVADLLQSFVAMPERYCELRARVVARPPSSSPGGGRSRASSPSGRARTLFSSEHKPNRAGLQEFVAGREWAR